MVRDSQWGPEKQLLDRFGKHASQGPPPDDPLLDETVLFKTVIGLKWIMWRSGKNCFWTDWEKMRPKGPALKDPLLDETALFKTVVVLKWATLDEAQASLLLLSLSLVLLL